MPANRPWAEVVGYSRAVRVGNQIEVSGTAAAGSDGTIIGEGDVYAQTKEALRIIGDALNEAGTGYPDVVRTRVFLKDPTKWAEAGRAHGEVFGDIRPTTAFIGASGFIDPDILVEIEATAIVDD